MLWHASTPSLLRATTLLLFAVAPALAVQTQEQRNFKANDRHDSGALLGANVVAQTADPNSAESALLTGLLIVLALFGLIVAFFLGYYIGTATSSSQLLSPTTTTSTAAAQESLQYHQQQYQQQTAYGNGRGAASNVSINIDRSQIHPSASAAMVAAAATHTRHMRATAVAPPPVGPVPDYSGLDLYRIKTK